MTGMIRYTSSGLRYYLNNIEVDQSTYDLALPSRLEEMLEAQQAPYGVTDSTFMKGKHEQFAATPKQGDFYAREAKRRGLKSVKGKRYLSQLARYPGDPRAFVSGRGDVQKVCEERGWGCEGLVSVAPVEKEKSPPTAVADDILESRAQREIAETVAQGEKAPEKAEVKERIKARIKPSWSK